MKKGSALKIYLIFHLFILILFINAANLRKLPSKHQNLDISLMYAVTLDYGEHVYISRYADENFEISWEFSGVNTYVGIQVWAFTKFNYEKFASSDYTHGFKLSNGSYIKDSGTFTPPTHDTWYIVFWNNDGDLQSTYLTYDVTFQDNNPFYEWFIGMIALFIIIAIGLAIGNSVYQKKKKREKEAKSQNTDLFLRKRDQEILARNKKNHSDNISEGNFCPSCGKKIESSHKEFCRYCGANLNE